MGEPRWRVLCADGRRHIVRDAVSLAVAHVAAAAFDRDSPCGPHRVERIPEDNQEGGQ